MRNKKLRKNNVIGFKYEYLSFKNVVVRTPSLVDEFYFEEVKSSDDKKKCIGYTDPIRMLFNQQRLSKLGTGAVNAWIDSLNNSPNDPLRELRSKCTDVELKYLIKSRNIQQPSEILAWAQYCQSNVDEFSEQLSKAAKELQQQQIADGKSTVDSGESVVGDDYKSNVL